MYNTSPVQYSNVLSLLCVQYVYSGVHAQYSTIAFPVITVNTVVVVRRVVLCQPAPLPRLMTSQSNTTAAADGEFTDIETAALSHESKAYRRRTGVAHPPLQSVAPTRQRLRRNKSDSTFGEHEDYRRRESNSWEMFRHLLNSLEQNESKSSLLRLVRHSLLACILSFRFSTRPLKRRLQSLRRMWRTWLAIFSGLTAVLATLFMIQLRHTCSIPKGFFNEKPFVEYYVHGRGMGHASRSIALVSRLNEAGIDVRLFTPRASFWEAHARSMESTLGQTAVVPIKSVLPRDGVFAGALRTLSRVFSDCSYAHRAKRFPDLVVSDGDLPGMLRAKVGGLPSIAIAHGQLFSIAEKPAYIESNRRLSDAWDRESAKNFAAGYFSKWTIATHFCTLDVVKEGGLVVKSPLRSEVVDMAEARNHAPLSFDLLPEKMEVRSLLEARQRGPRRRLVICYFRDKNGFAVVKLLMDAGFDVLLMTLDPHDATPDMLLKKSADEGPRLIPVSNRELFLPLMRIADGVAASAGSQLMTECIFSRMPLLALYQQVDDEQHLNVELSRQCDDSQVFGTSFESISDQEMSSAAGSLGSFISAVLKSHTSTLYYDFLEGRVSNEVHDTTEVSARSSLPDAAEVLVGIIQDSRRIKDAY